MPTYVYECTACKKEVEYFQSMTEAPKRKVGAKTQAKAAKKPSKPPAKKAGKAKSGGKGKKK